MNTKEATILFWRIAEYPKKRITADQIRKIKSIP
jgi:hypothetical protein